MVILYNKTTESIYSREQIFEITQISFYNSFQLLIFMAIPSLMFKNNTHYKDGWRKIMWKTISISQLKKHMWGEGAWIFRTRGISNESIEYFFELAVATD